MSAEKRKRAPREGQQTRTRRKQVNDIPVFESVKAGLAPPPRVITSRQYSSNSSGGFSASKIKVHLPSKALDGPQPRILFTHDDLTPSSIPEWPENDDELVGQMEGDALAHVWMAEEMANQKSDTVKSTDDPMKTWNEEIDHFLDEFIRLEGRGSFGNQESCFECQRGPAVFRCVDCFTDELFCSLCIITMHKRNPFHRLEKWCDPGFFEPTTLHQLGFRIQLGHPAGERCPVPDPATNFTILDTYCVHEISLDFCGCEKATNPVDQLLRARLYPATTKYPRTAATFNLLKRYELLSFESKCSAYQYYRSMLRETDNTGMSNTRERYREFLRMTRCWGALKIFKRAGRGHDPLGASGTQFGECALLCPACPQPGINLPDNWQDAPSNERWLYTLFLAIDANFRLRRKHVSSEDKDPAIHQGFGYFVKMKPYMEHLSMHATERQEPSQCVSHDAVNSADTRDTQGCAATGCGAVDCARHEFRRPNSIGDLQKGERYLNMDYLFYSTLANTSYTNLVVSYDIACQWSAKFHQRMSSKFPSEWFINNGDVDITFLVPKFHLPAHVEKCHRDYSFNLTKGVGRTDGEGVERGWARINDLASSTREMGPGARQDKLESHMGNSNWKKTTAMGHTLLAKFKNAVLTRSEQAEELSKMEDELEGEWLAKWRMEVEAWEDDQSRPNPYEPRVQDMSQADVRLMLAKQDASKKTGDSYASSVTGSGMIILGLELEEAQRRLREDMATMGLHPTVLQQAKMQERCNVVNRRLDAWCHVQAFFTPGVVLLRSLDAQRASSEPKIYDRKLYLPSEIAGLPDRIETKAAINIDTSLMETEWALREAQARDALASLRSHLRVKSYLTKYKQDHARGVSQNTRSQILIKQNLARVKMVAMKYRKAYDALAILESPLERNMSWRNALLPLEDKDIVGLPATGIGEGSRRFSWIWLAPGSTNGGEGEEGEKVQDVLRIQWLRARARVDCWAEEITLLLEEMRRVNAFLDYESKKWNRRATMWFKVSLEPSKNSSKMSPELLEGLVAYALHQAQICTQLRSRFLEDWKCAT